MANSSERDFLLWVAGSDYFQKTDEIFLTLWNVMWRCSAVETMSCTTGGVPI